jgi:3-oxoadipate enol-lactonase
MPIVNADGCAIYVEMEGPEQAPVLMLSNSLGTTLNMWDLQVAPFTQHFRLVRYDRRGHGRSSVPNGPYTMERLGRDVLAVLDVLGIERVNWCGLSMGGMVGQWLGANAPRRVARSPSSTPRISPTSSKRTRTRMRRWSSCWPSRRVPPNAERSDG